MTLVRHYGGVCGCGGLVDYVRAPSEGAELVEGSSAMRWATVPFWEFSRQKKVVCRKVRVNSSVEMSIESSKTLNIEWRDHIYMEDEGF